MTGTFLVQSRFLAVYFFWLEGIKMEDIQKLEITKIKPRYFAQMCPVCNGFGTLRYGTKECQGCIGKGYVLVPTGEKDGYGGTKT